MARLIPACINHLFLIGIILFLEASQAHAQTSQQWQLEAAGTVTVTGTDNVEPDQADRRSDLLTTSQINLGLNRASRNISARIGGTLAWDNYARTTRLNGLRYNALGLISSDFFDRRLSLDLRLNTEQQDIESSGATSAVERSIGSNQTQILNFTASPTLQTNFGSWAIARATYSVNGAYYFSTDTSDTVAPVSDAVIHRGTISLGTGSRFPRLRLTGIANAEETNRSSGGQDSARRDLQAEAEYQLFPRLRLTANVGYEEIEEPNFAADLEDAFGTVGFRWSPGPRTEITFNGGYRYEGPNFNGRIRYTFSEQINLDISYSESIETQQRLALGNLGNISFDDAGTPIDSQTGQELPPGSLPFDLQDNAFRSDAVNLALSGLIGRNRYRVNARYESRDTNGIESDSISVDVDITRSLTPLTSISLGGGIQETDQATSGTDRSWAGRVVYLHRLSQTFDLEARYAYVKRESLRTLSFRENVLRLSATKRF